ncbi:MULTISPECIES: prepilin peptidase [unclassified Campylobacter]|uniref:prepilin peptidase n=1 Tax=unclassified Campylobacter TaxID=2593542 RepID=UPI0022E9EA81|nr:MULTISPECIES: A24 family peptidase [unclassified Campylobacter]MDA3080273.1 prepilin peptidase [Campylobacter sp. CS_NA2]MDA3081861.1 prepilin peptidase [Campylobacter sp. CS_NA1]MDA3086330.1 prepilin peptidase [Campylobacter sp. CS_ED1]MDA3089602.1 prepilin peptidase [Campylobacter sp. CS_ED2]WBR51827.1 prepilin peptidase [Campylobacter sp. CS_NA3]
MQLDTLYGVVFFILGLCIGSFSNVLIYRLPREESINFPASHCTSCNTPLKFYHNIPLFSWIFLRGKCAFCKEKISFQYPLVELLGGLLMWIAYYFEPNLIKAAILGLCFIVLLALSAIDLKYKAVPDSLLYASLVFAVIYSLLFEFSFDGIIAGAIFAFAFWLLGKIVWKIKGQQALGEADIYIVAVMGAILGLSQGSLAILIGALLTIPAFAVANQKNYELPFVPFLALGLLITYMFGEKIVTFLKDVGILI